MKTYTRFHAGEVQVQAANGISTDAYEEVSIPMMVPDLKPNEAAFVEELTFSYAGSVDAAGRPWASPLLTTGEQLFTVNTPTKVRVAAALAEGDPLRSNIEATGQLSIKYLEPKTRRRSKSIGTATIDDLGAIDYEMTRNFGLCPKYIYKRLHEPGKSADATILPEQRDALNAADIAQIQASDTVFFASFSPHGADVTHRGGPAGFVLAHSPTKLEIPDYFGNGMFNTFGNLVLDDRMAFSTTDFVTGRTVHITGRASVEQTGLAEPAPQRRVHFDVDEVIVSHAAIGQWTDVEPSRYNPLPG